MKKIIISVVLTLALGICGVTAAFKTPGEFLPDNAALNDAVMAAAQCAGQTEAARILSNALTREQEKINLQRLNRDKLLQVFLYALIGVLTFQCAAFYFYCRKRILSPFKKLEAFAKNVAAGNLDVPLAMDRGNLFGAFTESFDIMREELKKARENERMANIKKKELVAQLSHDIKTPIASIKAVAELTLVKPVDLENRLNVILKKADQIDLLISNMFSAALEDLEQLKVIPADIPSVDLYEMLQNADYADKIKIGRIPECFVSADKARLQQVFDNIISNSYKYAATDIVAEAGFEGKYLAVSIKDFGAGVSSDELPLIFEKFYRGKNAGEKSGSGLGLYIAKYLLIKMGGDISCAPDADGFTVKILLAV